MSIPAEKDGLWDEDVYPPFICATAEERKKLPSLKMDCFPALVKNLVSWKESLLQSQICRESNATTTTEVVPLKTTSNEDEEEQKKINQCYGYPELSQVNSTYIKQMTSAPLHVLKFIDYFGVYKNFTACENHPWFKVGLPQCVVPTMDLLRLPGLEPGDLSVALMLVYILSRTAEAFNIFFKLDIFPYLLDLFTKKLHSTSPQTLVPAIKALGNLTFQVPNVHAYVNIYLEPIFQCILYYKHERQLVESGLWVVANLFFEKVDFPLKSVDIILEMFRLYPFQLGLHCEGCYAIYNLLCGGENPYHERLIDLDGVAFLCSRLPVYLSTRFIYPCFEILGRLIAGSKGRHAVYDSLEAILSITEPGRVTFYDFKDSSYAPKGENEYLDLLFQILRRLLLHPLDNANPNVENCRHHEALCYNFPPQVPSLQSLCATSLVHKFDGYEECLPENVLNTAVKVLRSCSLCTKSYTHPFAVVAHVSYVRRPGCYLWVCSKGCKEGALRSLLPESLNSSHLAMMHASSQLIPYHQNDFEDLDLPSDSDESLFSDEP